MQQNILLELRQDRVREDVAAYLHPLIDESLDDFIPFCDLVNWVADELIERLGLEGAETHAATKLQGRSAA